MHLAEGVLPLTQAAGWTIAAAPALLWSLRGEQRARVESASSSLIMAGATSLLFAATLLPLPVPVVGATSHVCLTPVLGLVIGATHPPRPSCSSFCRILRACGLTTLGVNTLTLGLLDP